MWKHVFGMYIRTELLYQQFQRLRVGDAHLRRRTFAHKYITREFRAMSASIQALHEQVDDLYAHLNALRHEQHSNNLGTQEHNTYPPPPQFGGSASQTYHHDSTSIPQPRAKHPPYQGPTSSAFNFEIANASLQSMGVTEPDLPEGNPVAFDESLSDPQLQAPVAPMAVHPDKDPLWRIGKDDAIRLCRLYNDEMGFMYPIVNIGEVIERAKFLFNFTEAATKSGLVRPDRSGPDRLTRIDNNILKMILATALTVEANGHSELGQSLFESVKDASENRLWEPAELKGLTLLVIIVCRFACSSTHRYTLMLYRPNTIFIPRTKSELTASPVLQLASV